MRKLKGNLIAAYNYVKGNDRQWSQTSVVPDGKTRDSSHKLQPERLQLEIRRNLFTLRVMQHWNKLSIDKEESPSQEAVKAWPEKSAADLIHISSSPVPSRRLEHITSRHPFQRVFFWFCEFMFSSDLQGSSFNVSFHVFIQKKEFCHRELNCCGSSGSGQVRLFQL